MLKKANKGQIVKGIDKESAFVNESDNSLILPVVLDKESVRFFDIKKIYTIFLPVAFVDRSDILATNPIFSNTVNDGFAIKEKPLHINRFMAQNKDRYFTLDKISERSSNNSLFRSLYGKNVVSSYGQEEFLGNFTTVTLNNSGDRDITIITRNAIEDINIAIGNVDDNSNNFSIKVYAENGAGEIVDYFFDNSSYNIIDFEDLSSDNDNRFDVLTTFAEEVSRGIRLTINPYTFPIDENIINGIPINGPQLNFDAQLISNLLRSEEAENATITVRSELISDEIGGSISLFSQAGISSVADFSSLVFGFSASLIRDNNNTTGYKNFIRDAYRYCKDNDLSNLNISYKTQLRVFFSGDFVPRIKTFSQDSSFSFESISNAYDDIKKYNFEKDLTSLNVIKASIELFNDSPPELRKYRVRLDFSIDEDESDYERRDVARGSIDFEFIDAAGNNFSNSEFFLDDNLTEGNSIIVNSGNLIWTYLPEGSRSVNFYFETARTQPVRFMFLKYTDNSNSNNLRLINIGPFAQSVSQVSSSVLSNVIYREAANLIGSNIRPEIDLEEKLPDLVRHSTREENYEIDLSRVINNPNFRSLGYFSDSDTNSDDAKLKNIIRNTIIKIEKSGFVNGIFTGFITKYAFLSDLSTFPIDGILSVNNNIFKINVKEDPEYFDVARLNNTLTNSLQVISDLAKFRADEPQDISENFRLDYKVNFSLIVLDKDIIENFGKPLTNLNADAARNKLFDFVFSLNENFNIEKVLEIQQNVFKEDATDDEINEAIRLIFDVTNLSLNYVNKTFEVSLQNEELKSQALLPSEFDVDASIEDEEETQQGINQLISANQSDIFNYLYEDPISVSSNLILDIDSNISDNTLIVGHASRRQNYSISLFGPSIVSLLNLFKSDSNSFVEESFISFNYAFDKSTTLIINRDSEDLISNKDFIFIKNDDDKIKNKVQMSVVFDQNDNLNLLPSNRGEYFQKYFDTEFYTFASSLISQNNRFNNTLIAKHAVIRVCVVLNINRTRYTILKNIFLESGRNLRDLPNSTRQGIIIKTDEVSQDVINMPSVFYKGNR